MSVKAGIVGLPNVGKSTIFKALTKKQVDAENYPFCTIEPNIGVVPVKDVRVGKLAKIASAEKTVYATVEFVDIAGLVRGAHEGKGLGNKFLAHIREVDVIVQVIRSFADKNIFHTEGEVDVDRDKDIINVELIYADIEMIEKVIIKLEKEVRAQNKEAQKKTAVLEKIKSSLEEEVMINTVPLTKEERLLIKEYNFLTDKPIIYLKNSDGIQEHEDEKNLIEINAKIELELGDMSEEEREDYKQELGLKESGLDRLIRESYRQLNLISFFTAGEIEAKAWSVTSGSTAPVAAGKIHTDFEKNFIKAEVVSCDNFIKYNGWAGAKKEGVVVEKGKDYVVKDGDVVFFKVGRTN